MSQISNSKKVNNNLTILKAEHPIEEVYLLQRTGYTRIKKRQIKVQIKIKITYFPEISFELYLVSDDHNDLKLTSNLEFFISNYHVSSWNALHKEKYKSIDEIVCFTTTYLNALTDSIKFVSEKINNYRISIDNRTIIKNKKHKK